MYIADTNIDILHHRKPNLVRASAAESSCMARTAFSDIHRACFINHEKLETSRLRLAIKASLRKSTRAALAYMKHALANGKPSLHQFSQQIASLAHHTVSQHHVLFKLHIVRCNPIGVRRFGEKIVSPLATFRRAKTSFGKTTPAELPTVVTFSLTISGSPHLNFNEDYSKLSRIQSLFRFPLKVMLPDLTTARHSAWPVLPCPSQGADNASLRSDPYARRRPVPCANRSHFAARSSGRFVAADAA